MATSPPQPLWLNVFRMVQVFLALVTLGLSGFSLSYFGAYSGYGLNIFSSILTFIYVGYIAVSSMVVQTLYSIWISLVFQVFLAIFWLSTFGTLAALSVAFGNVGGYNYSFDGYTYHHAGYTGTALAAVNTTRAATALSAFIWVSFCVTIIYTVIAALRGGRSTTTAVPTTQEVKMEPVGGQAMPTSYQPVQQFTAPYGAPGAEYPPQQQQPYAPAPYGAPGTEYNAQAAQQQFQQQPTAYPPQTTSPAPYQQQPTAYPQQTTSPAPYQQPVQYVQQPYPQQTGSPAPPPAGYPVHQPPPP